MFNSAVLLPVNQRGDARTPVCDYFSNTRMQRIQISDQRIARSNAHQTFAIGYR